MDDIIKDPWFQSIRLREQRAEDHKHNIVTAQTQER